MSTTMARTLFILNDPPYGTERSYNALPLANALSKREGEEVSSFSSAIRPHVRNRTRSCHRATTTSKCKVLFEKSWRYLKL